MIRVDRICLDDLSGEQRELAECIGIDAYRKLIATYAGQRVYVAMPETILRQRRNRAIRAAYNGHNLRALALRFGLSESSIRDILVPERSRIREAAQEPIEGQMTLLGDTPQGCGL